MRRTKIVCTIGPASDQPEMLRQLMRAGMDVARLNFSHGTHEEHATRIANIRRIAAEESRHIAIMLDTKGPEIRIGTFVQGSITLQSGDRFILTTEQIAGDENRVSVSYSGLARDIESGDRLLLDDGLLELTVQRIDGVDIHCRVVIGGVLSNRKGINIPSRRVNLPTISPQDEADLAFGVEHEVDFVAASFMRNAADVHEIRRFLESRGASIPIIAKIENKEGIDNLDAILKFSDGLMVARGDMGVEFPAEEVPIIQKRMIEKCNRVGKSVITATQMLDSMIRNPRPTRAEASDIANAIFDGSDAIMLSGETASGKYPLESVETMSRIASRTEKALQYEEIRRRRAESVSISTTDAISHATVQVANELSAAAILTSTQSGGTARTVSKYRPIAPVVAVTVSPRVARQMALLWGVYPVIGTETQSTDALMDSAIQRALEEGYIKNGDLVVITAGVPVGVPGTTNLLRVHVVGDVIARGSGIGNQVFEGTACVVRTAKDAEKFMQRGNILIAPATDRDYMDSIAKAGAVVTEEGGLTSHAAIVAVTLGIPAVVGVSGVTSMISTGTHVTIDASRGLIYRGQAKVR